MKNPIASTNHCLQGQKLPANWQQQAKQNAQQAEADYLHRLQNAWKKQTSTSDLPAIQNCRLRGDAADYPHTHNHPPHNGSRRAEIRADGQMVLVEERSDGWQHWRDDATGSSVWRRLKWSDVIGEK